MIVYPNDWEKNYEELAYSYDVSEFTESLLIVLKKINVNHLAYSGGIDSTVVLSLMSRLFDVVHTYTISSRADHPDVLFAKMGSELYKTNHREFIVKPTHKTSDIFKGDNAVRQLFEKVSEFTNDVICCDGVDEFMCGYYDHQVDTEHKYKHHLSRLLPDHLIPLNSASNNVRVFLPYLDLSLVNFYKSIPLDKKVDASFRKKVMIEVANVLEIPSGMINRNKYGFVDAFLGVNKPILD